MVSLLSMWAPSPSTNSPAGGGRPHSNCSATAQLNGALGPKKTSRKLKYSSVSTELPMPWRSWARLYPPSRCPGLSFSFCLRQRFQNFPDPGRFCFTSHGGNLTLGMGIFPAIEKVPQLGAQRVKLAKFNSETI